MKIQQIRNATMIVTYAGKKFLIDPMLADKGVYPPFPFTHNDHLNNPTVDLPISLNEILDVDAIIVTHLHIDHFDLIAMEIIDKQTKIFIQNENEAAQLREMGFMNVEVLTEDGVKFDNISLIKTPAMHYSDESILDIYRECKTSDEACGVIFNHENEDTLYIMGDTVWFEGLKSVLDKYTPDVIAINAGNAQFLDGRYLLMSKEDILETVKHAPYSKFLATHMESLNHLMVSRDELRNYSTKNGFSDKLIIPNDGEICEF